MRVHALSSGASTRELLEDVIIGNTQDADEADLEMEIAAGDKFRLHQKYQLLCNLSGRVWKALGEGKLSSLKVGDFVPVLEDYVKFDSKIEDYSSSPIRVTDPASVGDRDGAKSGAQELGRVLGMMFGAVLAGEWRSAVEQVEGEARKNARISWKEF